MNVLTVYLTNWTSLVGIRTRASVSQTFSTPIFTIYHWLKARGAWLMTPHKFSQGQLGGEECHEHTTHAYLRYQLQGTAPRDQHSFLFCSHGHQKELHLAQLDLVAGITYSWTTTLVVFVTFPMIDCFNSSLIFRVNSSLRFCFSQSNSFGLIDVYVWELCDGDPKLPKIYSKGCSS